MKLEHILIVTDLSSELLGHYQAAEDFARDSGARLTLLHVVEREHATGHVGMPVIPSIGPAESEERLERARARLAQDRARIAPEISVEEICLSAESVAEGVSSWAAENDVDMIVLSTHGRTGLRHLALGSVAEAILRRSPVPVLCIPPAGVPAQGSAV